MQKAEPLQPGAFYHIYNAGVGECDLFRETKDYEYFLRLYEKYIEPIAETYAWCLMKNHFHLLVRIKEDIRYKYSNADRSIDPVRFEERKWETTNLSAFKPEALEDSTKTPTPHLHFSHLFNAYTKYFNQHYKRRGALFLRSFKRKRLKDENYFRNVILYIHNNPVHHGFVRNPIDYPWSSYLTCISIKTTKLKRTSVVGWFDNMANFKELHLKKINEFIMSEWLEL
jgi:REP element-mobilizing transposase RayT